MTVPPGDEDTDQDTDQDATAAEPDAQVDGEGEDGDEQDDLAAEWEAMVGGGDDGMGGDAVSSVSGRETTRVLNQD
ncbi:MAG: flagellar motor switch protein FliM, partial [Rhodospirillaceae bacterium]|nr:flagellar motor switch protein FliM [Rhodospirillaceae bacterium]